MAPLPRELLPVRWACFQLSGAAQPSVAPALEKRHVHRSAHGEPVAGKCIAHLPRINSAQETCMETCVPGPRFRLGPETRVTLTPSPCPSCTMCVRQSTAMVTDRGRAIPQGHVASGDVHGPPGWCLQHLGVLCHKAGRLSPTHRLGHLAPGAAPQLHAHRGQRPKRGGAEEGSVSPACPLGAGGQASRPPRPRLRPADRRTDSRLTAARAPARHNGPAPTSRAIWFRASSSAVSRSRLGSRLRPAPWVPMSIGSAAAAAAAAGCSRRCAPGSRPAPPRPPSPSSLRPSSPSLRRRHGVSGAGTRGRGWSPGPRQRRGFWTRT